jgi:hypothetical protein
MTIANPVKMKMKMKVKMKITIKRGMKKDKMKRERVLARPLELTEQNKHVFIKKSHVTSPNLRYSYDKIGPGKPEAGSFETERNKRNKRNPLKKHSKV